MHNASILDDARLQLLITFPNPNSFPMPNASILDDTRLQLLIISTSIAAEHPSASYNYISSLDRDRLLARGVGEIVGVIGPRTFDE